MKKSLKNIWREQECNSISSEQNIVHFLKPSFLLNSRGAKSERGTAEDVEEWLSHPGSVHLPCAHTWDIGQAWARVELEVGRRGDELSDWPRLAQHVMTGWEGKTRQSIVKGSDWKTTKPCQVGMSPCPDHGTNKLYLQVSHSSLAQYDSLFMVSHRGVNSSLVFPNRKLFFFQGLCLLTQYHYWVIYLVHKVPLRWLGWKRIKNSDVKTERYL